MVFSGDVGSLSISYLLIGGLIEMMLAGSPETNGLQFCLVFLIPLSIFMMDSLTTLLHRMWLRQNIFQSHRFHLYQILTPNIIRSQLPVSIGYALIQLLVTFLFRDCTDLRVLFLYLIILFSVFLFLRFVFLRKPSMLTER
jgi:UDP-N-acetylmuramyl pentapeptide phosphotransferase/UDP-N-acetylglucosamine-1-phosphate transferase